MSMRTKIMIPMTVVAVVCAAVIGLLGVLVVKLFVGDFDRERLQSAHTLAASAIEDYKADARRASGIAAENGQLSAAIESRLAGGSHEPLVSACIYLMESAGVDFLTVTDVAGTVLARAHDPDNFGDSVASQINIKHALLGEQYTTIEEGTAVKLSVRCGTPVYSADNQLIGVVSAGFRLDQNKFVDYVKGLSKTEVTVFLRDTRVSTTITDAKGARAVGTQASKDVSAQVLGGSEYTGRVAVLGNNLLTRYSPLRDAEGHVLGMLFVGLDITATDARMSQDTLIMICVVAFLGLLSLLASWNIALRLSRPVTVLSGGAKKLAEGDVDIELGIAARQDTKDEVGILANEFCEMIKSIGRQADVLSAIADGDYSVYIPVRSERDVINLAINRVIDRNNELLAEIKTSSEQVAEASRQIADGAHMLELGTTEQASAIEELSASVGEIAGETNRNANIAKQAAALSGTIISNAEKGSAQMSQMMQAVMEINESSGQIEKVIKVIDEIAFQTNILALNAAVEAAKAGQHGKGFAIVAEEVRNLAAKSAVAAKDTGELIENSIKKANLGLDIATGTAESLQEIVEGINRNAEIVGQIAQTSEEQAGAIAQINAGIDRVSQVVQQNSAAAEQSAAASEQMSGQSGVLAQLIAQFKLKDEGDEHQKYNYG